MVFEKLQVFKNHFFACASRQFNKRVFGEAKTRRTQFARHLSADCVHSFSENIESASQSFEKAFLILQNNFTGNAGKMQAAISARILKHQNNSRPILLRGLFVSICFHISISLRSCIFERTPILPQYIRHDHFRIFSITSISIFCIRGQCRDVRQDNRENTIRHYRQ